MHIIIERGEATRARTAAARPMLTNAVGQHIIIAKHASLSGPANTITQTVSIKGGINRNYYGAEVNRSNRFPITIITIRL